METDDSDEKEKEEPKRNENQDKANDDNKKNLTKRRISEFSVDSRFARYELIEDCEKIPREKELMNDLLLGLERSSQSIDSLHSYLPKQNDLNVSNFYQNNHDYITENENEMAEFYI